MDFFSGLKVFVQSIREISASPQLRKWYVAAVTRTFILALLFLVFVLAVGIWFSWSGLDQSWLSGFGALIWVLVILFMSGMLTASVMNLFIVVLSSEQKLIQAYAQAWLTGERIFKKSSWKLKRRELSRVLVSVVVSLSCWPLVFFVVTLPLAILVFSWSMGREAQATGAKLFQELGGSESQALQELPASHALGLAIIPAVFSIFPVLGWALLPVLPYAGLRSRALIKAAI